MNNNKFTTNDMSTILNEYLANIHVLTLNLYNLHWNVVGEDFFPVHEKLQEYYEQTTIMFDEVAERIKMLGGYPITTLTEYQELSTINTMNSQDYSIKQAYEIVLNDFNFMLNFSNAIYAYADETKDANTIDLMTNYIMFFEKQIWMLKASLQ